MINSLALKDRVTAKEKIFGYLLGPAGCLVVNAVLATYLNLYYTDVLRLTGTFLVVLPVISRVVDAVTNFIMGIILDKTKTKYGRARPYIIISAVPFAIASILLVAVIMYFFKIEKQMHRISAEIKARKAAENDEK